MNRRNRWVLLAGALAVIWAANRRWSESHASEGESASGDTEVAYDATDTSDATDASEAEVAAPAPPKPAEPPRKPARRTTPKVALANHFTDVTGLALDYPADWSTTEGDGTTSFIPAGTPSGANGPVERHVLVFQGTDCTDAHDSEMLAALAEQFTQALPGFEQVGEAQWIEGGRHPGSLLTFSNRSAAGETLAEFRMKIQEPMACGLFSIGPADRLRDHRDVASAIFDSLELRQGQRDEELIGAWTSSDSYTNSLSEFSMASAVTIDLGADGRFTRSSQVAGGTADVGVDSEGAPERGVWFSADGRIVLVYDTGNTVTMQYRFHEGQLVTGKKGSYKFWSR